MSDNPLVTFKVINDFVNSLNDCFGKDQKTLQLYARLLSKTTISHEEAIEKHINIFKNFVRQNNSGIIEKDFSKFETTKISYNERVYIELNNIFSEAGKDEKNIIYQHLLNICSKVDPESNAKDILRESIRNNKQSGDCQAEENFLNGLIENVSKTIDENDDPAKTISNVMSSGIFTELVGGMTNGIDKGELDLGRLMGTVQGMVSTIAQMDDTSIPKMGGNGPANNQMDLGNMMMQMTAMMGNMNMAGGGMPGGMPGGSSSGMATKTSPSKKDSLKIEEIDDDEEGKLAEDHQKSSIEENVSTARLSNKKKRNRKKKSEGGKSTSSSSNHSDEGVIQREERNVVDIKDV